MIGDILYRLGQLLLALLIIGFVLYRLALSLDLVPEGFSPSGFVNKEYKEFKQQLLTQASHTNAIGKMSKILLRNLERVEKYIADKKKREAEQSKLEEECKENGLFRFFMYLGDDSDAKTKCTERNMSGKKAEQQLQDQLKGIQSPPMQETMPQEQQAPQTLKMQQQQQLQQQMQKRVDDQLKQIDEQFK